MRSFTPTSERYWEKVPRLLRLLGVWGIERETCQVDWELVDEVVAQVHMKASIIPLEMHELVAIAIWNVRRQLQKSKT